jgi:hypothetical protein
MNALDVWESQFTYPLHRQLFEFTHQSHTNAPLPQLKEQEARSKQRSAAHASCLLGHMRSLRSAVGRTGRHLRCRWRIPCYCNSRVEPSRAVSAARLLAECSPRCVRAPADGAV